jgi:hypothetical protein
MIIAKQENSRHPFAYLNGILTETANYGIDKTMSRDYIFNYIFLVRMRR